MENKRPREVNTILKKNQMRGLIILILDFKTYYEATVVKRVILVSRQTYRLMKQNRAEYRHTHI